MWAAAAGQRPVVQALIDSGADIHARSNSGDDAAHVCGAARRHAPRCARCWRPAPT